VAEVVFLAKLGWRNLWRHSRRTLLTALAFGLGLALLLISLGLLDGDHEQRIANRTRLVAGHVVVQAQGYQDTLSQKLLLSSRVVTATAESLKVGTLHPALGGVSPRLIASGLLSSAANASGVSILGVIPEKEKAFFLIPHRIVEGSYLDDEKATGIVIGAELARKLKVRVGSKVVLMAQAVRQSDAAAANDSGGELQSTLLRVVGIFRTGMLVVDMYVVHLPLAATQTLLGVPNQVTQVAIFLERESDSPIVARHLRSQLTGVPVEILTWQESLERMAQMIWLEDLFNNVIGGILLVMVGLGVLNTMLMAVLERRYELGVCAALGLRPGQLAGMIMCESLALGLISIAFGLVLGLGVHYHFATTGLDLRWFFDTDLRAVQSVFDPILYSRLSLARITGSVGIVFLMGIVISFYPAFKAARTELPNALRVL